MIKIRDLWTDAYVKSTGVKMLDISREGRSVTFIFEDTARDEILNYQNGALVSAIQLKSSIDDLKNIIYDFEFLKVDSK